MQIEIKKIGINGEGIGYVMKKPIFVDGALPTEIVEVEITNDNPKYANAKIIKFIKKSEKRVTPFCAFYKECGACSLQHLEYSESLKFKRDMVIESISKYTDLNPYSFEIKQMIPSLLDKGYRNKSSLRYRGEVMGIYRLNSNILVDIDNCPVQHPIINRVNQEVLSLMKKHRITGFDQKKNTGVIRHVVTRVSLAANEVQVTLVLGAKGEIKDLLKDIMQIDNVVSVYTDFNKEKSAIDIFGKKLRHELGEEKIIEKLDNFVFSLLPNTFFQLNPTQTVNLYNEVKKAAKLSKKEYVLDAYCGVGTIGIWVAKNAFEVLGIDANEKAILNAIENAELNKSKNVKFLCGEISKVLLENNTFKPDVIITDPPRTGLGSLIDLLINYKAKRIVYVSCNPSTMAKDLKLLTPYYDVKYIQPIDMFPYTAHVETITLLSLKAA